MNHPAPQPGSLGRVVRNSVVRLVALVLTTVLNLVPIIFLTRALGPGGVGEYYFFNTLIMVTQLLAEGGTSTVLTRRLSAHPATWREDVAGAVPMAVLVCGASVGVLMGIGGVWAGVRGDGALLPLFGYAAATCAALQVQVFASAVLQSVERMEFESVGRVLQSGSNALLIALLVRPDRPGGLPTALALFAASHALAALFLVAVLQGGWRCLGWRWDTTGLRRWYAEAVPLGFGDVTRRLTLEIDTILLRAFQPAAVVGVYSVALRPMGPVLLLPRVLLVALFPSFARRAAVGPEALSPAFARSFRFLWVLNLPVAIVISVYAEPIVRFLAGEEFLESAIPLRLLVWLTSVVFLSHSFRFVFTALGQQHLFTRLVVVTFLIETALEAATIPTWAYYGACFGSLVGETFFLAAGLWVGRRLGLGGIEWGRLGRAALAAAVTAALLWPTRALGPAAGGLSVALFAYLAAAGAGATTIYLALCVVFGAVRREELRHLIEAVRGFVARRRARAALDPPAE